MVREALFLFLNASGEEFDVQLELVLPTDWEHAASEARKRRRSVRGNEVPSRARSTGLRAEAGSPAQ